MASVRIKEVVKCFGKVRAVDQVSLEIKKGELFFLLGPSGCGKTTLLRLLAGFHQPDAGQIYFDEIEVTQTPPYRRNTGMVFQNYALWPHMTVRENLAFGLEMQHLTVKERRQRVDAMLHMIQMGDYGNRPPAQLSGGQQQRIALGRALILQPEVVLLDEPLSNLDAKLRLEMREHIKRLHQQLGLTMVYVTHDQHEALSMADRIAIMHQGKIFQLGTPREIYNRPANRFIADFIGETNLLPGQVTEMGASVKVATANGDLWSTSPFPGLQIGAAVYCSVRPERLTLRTQTRNFVNQWAGEVLRVVYLGNHEQYFLRLHNGDELKVIEYNIENSLAEPGKMVTVGCDAHDVVLLRKEA